MTSSDDDVLKSMGLFISVLRSTGGNFHHFKRLSRKSKKLKIFTCNISLHDFGVPELSCIIIIFFIYLCFHICMNVCV